VPILGYDQLIADPLFQRIAGGNATAILILDYDGTLAPFVENPSDARPYPDVSRILDDLPLRGQGRYIIVSGRPCYEAAGMLGVKSPPEVWGCHGAERLHAGGLLSHEFAGPNGPAAAVLDATLAAAGRAAAKVFPQARLERKSCSLAAHWRGLDPAIIQVGSPALQSAWVPLAGEHCELLEFAAGLEIRPKSVNKGLAVLRVKAENPDSALVYLGDDTTDEDAFRVLGKGDIAVLVQAVERSSLAAFRICPPVELVAFLDFWRQLHKGKRPRAVDETQERTL
jgi:trehalose 6-phosphate phosphatase